MKIRTIAFLLFTHGVIGLLGVGLGIYLLPIITAPAAPTLGEIESIASQARYKGQFRKDLKDSDFLHWGAGTVSITNHSIALKGKLAPGPDYKLYLSPEFIETEVDFNRLKPTMVRAGDVNTFDNFVVNLQPGIEPSKYTTVIIWCEAFSQFITSAKYQ